jgi:hypothetical protein
MEGTYTRCLFMKVIKGFCGLSGRIRNRVDSKVRDTARGIVLSKTKKGVHSVLPVNATSRSGAMTVEAALVLPVLLCAFFTVIFLIKAVYTYELIGHALNETASEMSTAGYVYHISGIRDLHDTVRNGIADKSDVFKNQIDGVFDAYNSLKSIDAVNPGQDSSQGSQGLGGLADSAELIANANEKFQSIVNQAGSVVSDPLEELKSIACYIVGGVFDDAKTQLFIPVTKLYMKKYLVTQSVADADERLRALHIVDGFDGLNFGDSTFVSDRGEYIDIVVRYRINLPLPIKFAPDLEFVQRARVKAWMGGDETQAVLEGSREDIWSLSNFQRGLKIRRLFGANLPTSFPVIAKFVNGKAVMIKSMDLTAASYQAGDNAEKTLKGYLNELVKYKGQEKPWGSDDILIRGKDITSRELLLVIPKNDLSDANEKLLLDMADIAASKGVKLVVERYGVKGSGKSDTENPGDTDSPSEPSNTVKPHDTGGSGESAQ